MVGRGFEHEFSLLLLLLLMKWYINHDCGHQLVLLLMAMVPKKMSLSFPKSFLVWYFLGEFLRLVLQESIGVKMTRLLSLAVKDVVD